MGAIGALLGACLAFLRRSGALLGRLLSLMGASDLIFVGFGESLGRVLREFGKGFGRASEDLNFIAGMSSNSLYVFNQFILIIYRTFTLKQRLI